MTDKELKKLQALEKKKYRKKYGLFLIEGKRIVETALEFSANLEKAYFSEVFGENNKSTISSLHNAGIPIERISEKQLRKISTTKSPSGILATCLFPDSVDPDLSKGNWLYLDRITDPGNLGTILRTAAWFNVNRISLSPDCVDPFNPKVVRSSMGAHFRLNIHSNVDLKLFKKNSFTVLGADHRGDSINNLIQVPERWILVLGNEALGLSPHVLGEINTLVAIEKIGFGESLNIGVAGAILMYYLSNKQKAGQSLDCPANGAG